MRRSHYSLAPLLACGALLTGLLIVATSEGTDETAGNRADRDLARQTMDRWKSELARDATWFEKELNLRKMNRDIWSTIDLEEAIRQEAGGSVASIDLLEKLAAAGRGDEVVRFSGGDKKGSYQLHRFWARVAEYGLAQNDMKIIELAGIQVEANASFDAGFAGSPPRPSRNLLGARFMVAAARLELLRGRGDDWVRHKDVIRAADDLWRIAGAFTPQRGALVGVPDSISPLLHYAALESWGAYGSYPVFQNAYQPLLDETRLKRLHEIVAEAKLGWPVRLPKLDDSVVTPWLQRQVHQRRHLVALTYLARAKGAAADRARLLAIVAAGLHETNPDQARVCREIAQALLDPEAIPNQNEWLRIEANAEIALAHHAAGVPHAAREIADQAVGEIGSLIASKPARETINYDSISVVLCAAANVGYTRSELPAELLLRVDRLGFYGVAKEANPIRIHGIDRITDISRIAKPVIPPEKPTTYQTLVEQKDWPAAVDEAARLAAGNSAWNSSHPELGAKSCRDLGLEGTLQWTTTIENHKVRMMVELGAIREAIKPDRRTLPRRLWQTPSTIAPGLNAFPIGC